mgnify:FL=1
MKKLLAFLLVLALAVCMLPGLALAEETAPTFDLTKDLEDITIPNDLVTCICTTTKESKQYGQLPNGFSASIVIKEGDVWTVIISVVNLVYKEQFDNDTGSEHTQDNNYPNEFINQIQFKLKYEGNKWVLGGEMPKGKTLHFTCKDNHTVPQPDKPPAKPEPENTSKPVVGLTGEEAVKVHCTTNAKHAAMRCDLLENSFDIGVVTKDETSGEYFCNITVHADKYVKKYNEYLKDHTLETEGQTGTIKLKWKPDDTGDNTGLWEVVSGVPVVFNVKCETQPQPDTFPGVITVKKTVDSNVPADKNKEFNFKVTVLIPIDPNPDPSGPPNAKSANAVKAPAVRGANKTATKDAFVEENDIWTLRFTLKGGDMMTISDLPVGFTYRVEELDADGYTVTVNNETTTSKDVGLTKENPKMTLNFKNTKGSTPTPTPYNGGGHSHYHPTTTPVPVMVIPPKTGDMTLLQYIARLLGLVR